MSVNVKCLGYRRLDVSLQDGLRLLTTALRSIANSGLGGHQDVHRQQWRLIKRLIESSHPISTLVSLAAILGLPCPGHDSNPLDDHAKNGINTLDLLAAHLEDMGMGQGFEALGKDSPEFLGSLNALRQHFSNQGVDAQGFRACPIATFVPGIDAITDSGQAIIFTYTNLEGDTSPRHALEVVTDEGGHVGRLRL